MATANDSTTDCTAKRAEAIEIANDGDQRVKVNVLRSIELYREALEVDPSAHRILWKLAAACEKTEDWPCVMEAMTRASALAPTFARYWHKLGYAYVMIGEAGDTSAFERARPALETCIARDPNIAQCHFLLGEALEWTDHEQGALSAYTNAIARDPTIGMFYPPLVELYLSFGLRSQAKAVAREGVRVIEPSIKTQASLYWLHVHMAAMARHDGDQGEALRELEQAEMFAGDTHPEFAFELGTAYLALEPPQKDRARRLLQYFVKRTCRGAAAKTFREPCETATTLLQTLGAP